MRSRFTQQQFYAICRPGCDTRPEQIHIFRPNRTFKGQCRRQHGPILFITLLQPLPRSGFKSTVDPGFHATDKCCQLIEHGNGKYRIDISFLQDLWKVLASLRKSSVRCKESNPLKVPFEYRSDALAKSARISMFASRTTISGVGLLSAVTACLFEVVQQLIFGDSACCEECIKLYGRRSQSPQVRSILAGTGGDVISHRFSVARNGDRSGSFQECCQLLTKFPNADLLCLHKT